MINYKLYGSKRQEFDFLKRPTSQKMKSKTLASAYRTIAKSTVLGESNSAAYMRRADEVEHCGEYLRFAHEEGEEKRKLVDARFCRDRLCPFCNWLKSLKLFGQLSRILDFLKEDYAFIFLTLTIPDLPEQDLDLGLDRLFAAWAMLAKRKAYKKAIRGAFRALEVTVKHDDQVGVDLYHPHFHAILAVRKSYFTDTKVYLSHDAWTDLWVDCCTKAGIEVPLVKNPKTGIEQPFLSVDVRRIRSRGGRAAEASAAAETAKYTLKDTEYLGAELSEIDRVVRVFFLSYALKGRRLISFSGVFRKARKALELDDPESGDLTEKSEISDDIWYILEHFGWRGVGYVAEDVERVSGAELKRRKAEKAQKAAESRKAREDAERVRGRRRLAVAAAVRTERQQARAARDRALYDSITYEELRRRFHHSD